MRIKIINDCNTEDWKSNIANPRADLKSGTIMEVKEMQNYFGKYYEGRHGGAFYYIDKRNAKLIND